MIVTPNELYQEIRFWLPLVSAFALVIKAYFGAKKNATEWANKLLDNHLSHIQSATESTAGSVGQLGKILFDHQDKEMQVWQGVVQSLAVLSDRTATARRKVAKISKRKKK